MSLKEELEAIRAHSATRIPPPAQALMKQATDELRSSGIVERALKVGDKAPEFSLPNTKGVLVSSRALLAQGPLVLSFYRGRW
jgi:AhpC/TSA family